ncbi:MAG: thioredoxin family protein [Sedimentisphaerales bacterium]
MSTAPAIAGEYGVRAIPTVLIIKDGKEMKRLVGLRPESEYADQLDELIY